MPDANRQPPNVGRPSSADCARGIAVAVIEVQRPGQFVAIAVAGADRFPYGCWERGSVYLGAGIAIRPAVAIQVVADGVELLKVGDFDQPVAVGVVRAISRLGIGDT